jgi:hypothetical protein
MDGPRLLRLGAPPARKEKRLQSLLAGRDPHHAALRETVQDAQILGSLELAGLPATQDEVAAARRGQPAPPAVRGLLRAAAAVEPAAPLTVGALCAWHAAALDGGGLLRTAERARDGGPPPAPARFVAGRLEILGAWLAEESSRELRPAQLGALALARILEILPFPEGNGRVSRLAASHLMVRAGARPPVLLGADAPRLEAALRAAFQLQTEPLVTLLEEAAERSLDLMIRALEAEAPPALS